MTRFNGIFEKYPNLDDFSSSPATSAPKRKRSNKKTSNKAKLPNTPSVSGGTVFSPLISANTVTEHGGSKTDATIVPDPALRTPATNTDIVMGSVNPLSAASNSTPTLRSKKAQKYSTSQLNHGSTSASSNRDVESRHPVLAQPTSVAAVEVPEGSANPFSVASVRTPTLRNKKALKNPTSSTNVASSSTPTVRNVEFDYVSEAHEEEESGDEDQASELDTIRAKFKTIYLTYWDSMAWPTFRDMFTAMYIDNSRLSSVEKLFHLVQKTKGEAKEIVQKSPLTNNGFAQAWSSLCDRYENKRILVNGQLKVLFNLPTVHFESSQGLKRLQRDINSCISVLKTYDIDVKSWDPIFVFLCSNRLPDSTLTLWEQTLSDKSSIPRWAELDKFLTNRYLTLEYVSEMRRGVPGSIHKENSSEGKSKPSKNFSSFQNKVSDPKCPLCPNEAHIIRKCPKFLRMNPDARSSEIKRQGLCLNCFSKTHSVKNCPSQHNCYTCNKQHNTLLHKIPVNSASSVPSTASNKASHSNLNPSSASFSRSEIQSTSNGAGNVQNFFSTNAQGVLLGTAMVQIVHNGVTYSARALFDSGSEEISRFWEVENLPRKNFLSPSDQFCEDLFKCTTTRAGDGRYIVRLPFKEANSNGVGLGHSRSSAMAQFLRNEARLMRTPELKEEYDRVVREYSELGHMHLVPSSSSSSRTNYYLPHHAVVKPDRASTKVRVVFNASSPSSSGLSLNDILHTGPILQSDLTMLILRWRFFRYVFNADIEKMYRQILVHPEDAKFQRILFRSTPNEEVQDFQLQTVTFGVNSAPYLAIRVLHQLADDILSELPRASDILRNFMYVDDVLGGAHSISLALSSIQELQSALKSAGFSLRKWTANVKDILTDIPSEHLLRKDFLEFEESSTAKMLGIRWDAHSDSFFFMAKPFSDSVTYTKRLLLSQIAKLFDPAGWLSPCVVLAKILMQRIWASGIDWDEILSQDIVSDWLRFQADFPSIDKIRIPRWVHFTPASTVQFHGFCDASESAYAAALYVRISSGASISTHLVYSKTKVAPLKTLSIPRLELCGAALLSEMIDSLLPLLDVPSYSIFCWTDSTIVLSWLAKPPCFWKTFVANRVSNIIQVVDSSKNPADLASRGVLPSDLVGNDLWWQGPHWLRDSSTTWCAGNVTVPDTTLERKSIQVNFAYFSEFDDVLARFSCFGKALRSLALVYRFISRTHPRHRSNSVPQSGPLTSDELNLARNRWIQVCQKAFYPNEYNALSAKRSIPASSCIRNLNPFLDSEGIIRSSGRLSSSPGLSFNEKHPIILPSNCHYSKLLVSFVHSVTLHGGNQLVLRIIRSQYWIPKVKNLIKVTINKCKACILYKHRCQRQLMAALPPERTEFSRPFTRTGLDFAGPFDIKTYNGRSCRITKGYVCVFVCFSTKAIHLEATSDLSTSTFLSAFHRFVSRRGSPLHLYSDNGTTFVGASKLLARNFLQAVREGVTAHYGLQQLTWHFIPPGAPHMGGLWEAGVKSFKAHFRKFAGTMKFTFEEFSTLLSRIEACLNSRPLSPISQDPTDLAALTPGHFLIGTPILVPVDPSVDISSISMLNRWEKLKAIHQTFCSRWKNEYLRELQKRNKWQTSEPNVTVDSLVAVIDDNLPPNAWRLGRISKVYMGSDGRVRVEDVVTQRGTITRPITKLVVISAQN
ncbi:uncharacterized protein [Musca autumnalis]|uniref:uncharacterized protein n=1 Tax=Musca autumnalis TaxID=221902 RepID=UPI003CE6DFCF